MFGPQHTHQHHPPSLPSPRPSSRPIIVHHQELLNPDLIGVATPEDDLDPDISHLSITKSQTSSHTNSGTQNIYDTNFPSSQHHQPTRNRFDNSPAPQPLSHTGSLNPPFHTTSSHQPSFSYTPTSYQPSMLTPVSGSSSSTFRPTSHYDVSPNIVDVRGMQTSSIDHHSGHSQSFYQKSQTTVKLPLAVVYFNPKYLSRDMVLSQFHLHRSEELPHDSGIFEAMTQRPNNRRTGLQPYYRKPLLTPSDSNSRRQTASTTAGFTNTFDLNTSHDSSASHHQTRRHHDTAHLHPPNRQHSTLIRPDSDIQTAFSSPHLSPSLHDVTNHRPTTLSDSLVKHDVRARTEACRYVSCQKLAAICTQGIGQPHHYAFRNKRQLSMDELPFTCGLHEVCCTLEAPQMIPSAGGHSLARPQAAASGSSNTAGVSTCGRSSHVTLTGRISVSGQANEGDAGFGEYPWQAAVLKKEGVDNVYVCAGTLVDATHVLTAAHCVTGYHASEMRVRLGEYDVNRDSEFYSHQETDVEAIFVHPEFYPGNLLNDIALIRIHQPMDFNTNPHISPVCLPRAGDVFASHRCWVTGWGKDGFISSARYQNILKEVDVPVLSASDCENRLRTTRLGPTYQLHPGMLCAGGEPGKDACKGDGGGPLTCVDASGRHRLAGLVSWGIGCGTPGIPGVYVNVQHYLEWILRVAL